MRLLRALLAVALLLGSQALASVGCICTHDCTHASEAEAAPAASTRACCTHAHTHVHARALPPATPSSEPRPGTVPPANRPEPQDGGSCDCGYVQPLMAAESWGLPTDAHSFAFARACDLAFATVPATPPLCEGAGPPPRATGEPPGCPCSANPKSLPVLTI